MTDAELDAEHKALLREAADLTAEDARLKQVHDPAGERELWRKLQDHVIRFKAFTDAMRAREKRPPD